MHESKINLRNFSHQCMARRQVANEGNGLQIWRIAANTLEKQSRTAEKGRCLGLRV